jgi:hypothetical protein
MNQKIKNINRWDLIAFQCVAIFLILSLWLWAPSQFVKITADGVGEIFEAYHGAMNLALFGWRWGGLQDMATSTDLVAHPFLYIHHGNLGLYFSYLLMYCGITSIEGQNLSSLLASAFGLLICYYSFYQLTKNKLSSLLFLIFLALDWNYIDNWAFNIHRAFSYLSVMGTILAFCRLWDTNFKSIFWLISFIVLCITLLLSDYIFFFFCFIFLTILIFSKDSYSNQFSIFKPLFILCLIFGLAFALRQIQVILGAGLEVWKHDFLYQILNRLHMEKLFQGNWPKDTTDFYTNNSILNPGFAPPVDWGLRLTGFIDAIGSAFLVHVAGLQDVPKYLFFPVGVVFAILLFSMIAFHFLNNHKRFTNFHVLIRFTSQCATIAILMSMVFAVVQRWNIISIEIGIALIIISFLISLFLYFKNFSFFNLESFSYVNIFNVSLILIISCLSMYAIFPRYFYQWYPAFLLAPLCMMFWTIALISPILEPVQAKRSFAFVIVFAVLSLKSIAILPNVLIKPENLGGHADGLRAIAGEPVASNFTPASVSSYTNSFAGWLKADAVKKLFLEGQVATDDYFMFFEVNKLNKIYEKPHYYVFFKKFGTMAELELIRGYGKPLILENSSIVIFKI